MNREDLRAIRKYPGYYADKDGNIYSYRSGVCRKLNQRLHRGYLHVTVKDNNYPAKRHKEPVHKLILTAFVGDRQGDQVCRHLNGCATDNRLENLCWGTAKENVQDSIRHGTAVCLRRGEEASRSKLKKADVLAIRELYKQGHLQREIASAFSISQRHVSDIVNGKTWVKDIT